jgi:hypothetical protein
VRALRRCVTYDAINGVWAEYDAKARVSWCGPAGLCRSRLARMVAGTGALLAGAMTRAGYRTSSGRCGRTHRVLTWVLAWYLRGTAGYSYTRGRDLSMH